jgi:ABC-2 type transport system permease protein
MRKNPMDSSGGMLNEAFFLPWLTALIGLPAVSVVLIGYWLENPILQWAGLPVGMATGAGFAWWLGHIAYRRLEASGPELLNLLLKGPETQANRGKKSHSEKARMEMPLWKKVIVWICASLFWIPLSLQGIIPIVMKLNGYAGVPSGERSWFLAFNFPAEFQWPVIMIMMALGVFMAFAAFLIPRKHQRKVQQRETDTLGD